MTSEVVGRILSLHLTHTEHARHRIVQLEPDPIHDTHDIVDHMADEQPTVCPVRRERSGGRLRGRCGRHGVVHQILGLEVVGILGEVVAQFDGDDLGEDICHDSRATATYLQLDEFCRAGLSVEEHERLLVLLHIRCGIFNSQRSIIEHRWRRAMHQPNSCLIRGAGVLGDNVSDDEIGLVGLEVACGQQSRVHPGGRVGRLSLRFGVFCNSVAHFSTSIPCCMVR